MGHLLVLLPVMLVLSAAIPFSDGHLTCLSCDSSIEPRDCQYTSKCGPHEVCYTTSYATSVGTIKHKTGCRDSNQCSSPLKVRETGNDIMICTECCNGTLCNSGLCSQDAIPPLSTRGPICYSCDQQTDPSSCHVIKQCGLDQECMLLRYESQMGNDLIYKTQCVSKQVCAEKLAMYKAALGSSAVLGKRSASGQNHCALKCCDTDLCNSDCTGDRVVSLTNTNIGHLVFSKATTSTTTRRTTSTTTTATTTTTSTTSRPTTHSASCADIHTAQYCQSEISMCTSAYTDQKNWAYHYCRRTCNLCNYQPSSTGTSSCTDSWSLSSCTYYKYWCSHPSGDNYQTLKMCQKTCNVC